MSDTFIYLYLCIYTLYLLFVHPRVPPLSCLQQIYYGNEDAEEQQHLEYQGSKQVGLELNKPPVSSSSNPGWDHSHAPTSIYPNQAADAVKFVSGPAGLLGAHGEAGVRPGTDRDAAADVSGGALHLPADCMCRT
eukprot:1157555-Pelagomonas_calceolata.AAC.7